MPDFFLFPLMSAGRGRAAQGRSLPQQPCPNTDQRGFTLVEVLVAVLIIGIMITGFQQILSSFLDIHQYTRDTSGLINHGRFAMDRMVQMVQETEEIDQPALGNSGSLLKISERTLDMHSNTSRIYAAGGDGYPDADNDADGLANNSPGGGDDTEWSSFSLDTSDAGNWKLVEILPDYTTSAMNDYLGQRILCEHVTQFTCTRMSPSLVEIELTLEDKGRTIHLNTRALAGRTGP